jgi:BlaI family penicillinase repressor
MKRFTAKEEEIMNFFWDKGPLFVKEILSFYDEPKPHFNTISTVVRELDARGILGHHVYGNTYQYYPLITREDYSKSSLRNIIDSYFNKSYMSAVSALVSEEDISIDDLKKLIQDIERSHSQK